jgi:hypothetical protein
VSGRRQVSSFGKEEKVTVLYEYDTRSRLPYASKVLPNRPFQARPRLGDWLGRPHAIANVWTTGRRTRRHGVIGRGHIRIGRRRDVLSGEVPSLERQSGRDERSRVRVEFECPGRVRPCGADGLRQRVRSEPSLKASKVVSKLSEQHVLSTGVPAPPGVFLPVRLPPVERVAAASGSQGAASESAAGSGRLRGCGR